MTDNEKMMLPLKILSDLSLNAGTIDIEEPMKYSVDGGATWVTTEAVSVSFTEEEIDKLV